MTSQALVVNAPLPYEKSKRKNSIPDKESRMKKKTEETPIMELDDESAYQGARASSRREVVKKDR